MYYVSDIEVRLIWWSVEKPGSQAAEIRKSTRCTRMIWRVEGLRGMATKNYRSRVEINGNESERHLREFAIIVSQ